MCVLTMRSALLVCMCARSWTRVTRTHMCSFRGAGYSCACSFMRCGLLVWVCTCSWGVGYSSAWRARPWVCVTHMCVCSWSVTCMRLYSWGVCYLCVCSFMGCVLLICVCAHFWGAHYAYACVLIFGVHVTCMCVLIHGAPVSRVCACLWGVCYSHACVLVYRVVVLLSGSERRLQSLTTLAHMLCYLTAVKLTSLCFSAVFSKMGMIIVPTSERCYED